MFPLFQRKVPTKRALFPHIFISIASNNHWQKQPFLVIFYQLFCQPWFAHINGTQFFLVKMTNQGSGHMGQDSEDCDGGFHPQVRAEKQPLWVWSWILHESTSQFSANLPCLWMSQILTGADNSPEIFCTRIFYTHIYIYIYSRSMSVAYKIDRWVFKL